MKGNNMTIKGQRIYGGDIQEIKKGDKLLVDNGLGQCSATAVESGRQGKGSKKTLLVDLKASEVGMFDEIGSVYATDILWKLDT
tara:strand:+ start:28 stop:279 length:252 start_codon:yes stop_codon:yes gene_type:complete